MNLCLTGDQVTGAALIDYNLVIDTAAGYRLDVEHLIQFRGSEGDFTIDPQMTISGPNTERLDSLIGQPITSAVVDDNKQLRIRCGDAIELLVPPDDSFEAWNLSGPQGPIVVSMPGGDLATWSS